MTTDAIKLLICEDSEDDAVLIAAHLRRGGLVVDVERADRAEQVAEVLRLRPPDLVISDYSMPGFGAEQALELLRASGLDIPFVLVSGRIGEELAAGLMRAGAHDFVLKDRMARLVQVICRELAQAEQRRERRQVEAALRLSEQRFRLFADHSPDVMFRYRLRPAEEVEYLSPAASTVFGHPPEELCGNPGLLFSLVAPDDREALRAAWHAPDSRPLVVRWCRPDGSEVWTEQRAVALHDEAGQVVAVEGILRDITQRVQADAQRESLQQQLRQIERLESLGRLAGGISHDFNNLLAVILGRTELVLDELPEDSEHRPGMLLIHELAERGAAVTRQLLVFSRQEPLRPETLDTNEVVAATERVLRGAIGVDVELVTRLAPGLWPVTIDRSELERLLLNLVANSRHAMPHGGRLVIETSNVEAADGASAPLVRLRVADSGTGMPEEVRKHAFEPFYTTDHAGTGTGLGLSSAYGMVKAAGGQITLSSRPGAGTTVIVDLPAVRRPADHSSAMPGRPALPAGAGRRLLVVEDDAAVREMVALMVRRHGYRPVAVSSPAEALDVLTGVDEPVDALLTDMVMAGMSGLELARAARARRPALPVVVMTGFAAAPFGHPEPPDGIPMIRKPFTSGALLGALGRALDADGRR